MERVSFDKIMSRIKILCYELDDDYVDYSEVTQKVIKVFLRNFTNFALFSAFRVSMMVSLQLSWTIWPPKLVPKWP